MTKLATAVLIVGMAVAFIGTLLLYRPVGWTSMGVGVLLIIVAALLGAPIKDRGEE